MPVLLLAKGDAQSKDLLRRAIEARYGFRPPALDSLLVELKGRIHVKNGLVQTWIPVAISVRIKFPLRMRWEHTAKTFGLPLQRNIQAYDGLVYRRMSGGKPVVIADPQQVASVHQRLWTMCAVVLTPLTEHYVELHGSGDHKLDATNTETDDTARLLLNGASGLAQVETVCYNARAEKEQTFSLTLSSEQVTLGDLILPRLIVAAWDRVPYLQLQPVNAEMNPELADEIFTLEK